MSTFTIDNESNVTVYAGTEEAAQAGGSTATSFDSLAALSKVSADWQMSRFVEIWNSIPGQSPVKKFTDPKSAVTRIWKAIQPLAGSAQPSEPATKAKKPAKAPKPTKETKPAKKGEPAKPGADKVEGSNKKVEVIAMMKRSKGASLAEIMDATGWQSTRFAVREHPGQQGRPQH